MLIFLDKHCVALCVDNMQRVQELSPIELVEMFVTVFCFLKDSSEVSQTLLDDFRRNSGYEFLTHFLLRLVQSPPLLLLAFGILLKLTASTVFWF